MQYPYQNSGDGLPPFSGFRGRGGYVRGRHGFVRGRGRYGYPTPPPASREEILMEAGRLAAEYLVWKGEISPRFLPPPTPPRFGNPGFQYGPHQRVPYPSRFENPGLHGPYQREEYSRGRGWGFGYGRGFRRGRGEEEVGNGYYSMEQCRGGSVDVSLKSEASGESTSCSSPAANADGSNVVDDGNAADDNTSDELKKRKRIMQEEDVQPCADDDEHEALSTDSKLLKVDQVSINEVTNALDVEDQGFCEVIVVEEVIKDSSNEALNMNQSNTSECHEQDEIKLAKGVDEDKQVDLGSKSEQGYGVKVEVDEEVINNHFDLNVVATSPEIGEISDNPVLDSLPILEGKEAMDELEVDDQTVNTCFDLN